MLKLNPLTHRRLKNEKKSETLYIGQYEKHCYNPLCNKLIRINKTKHSGLKGVASGLFCCPECKKEHRKRVMLEYGHSLRYYSLINSAKAEVLAYDRR